MEYWDVYDVNREKTGRIVERHSDDWLKENEYHLGIHIAIFNSKNEMLIQKRSLNKRANPGKWDFSGRGSVVKGETSQEGARRELLEELGFDFDFSNERARFTINCENLFDDYYIIKQDINLDELVLQKEEVDAVKWASKEEIIDMIDNDEFAEKNVELMKFIFSLF